MWKYLQIVSRVIQSFLEEESHEVVGLGREKGKVGLKKIV